MYLAGLTLGNYSFVHKRSLRHYHDSLAWLMQIVMFLTLGLLVFPLRLIPVADTGLLICFLLMLFARPMAALLCLLPFRGMPLADRLMVSWVGLRGSVPIILATYPLISGIEKADMIFNVVFFVVLTSVLVQGSSIPFVARRLGVTEPLKPFPEQPEAAPEGTGWEPLAKLRVLPGSAAVGRQIVDLNLPEDAWIAVLRRDGHPLRPSGSTILQPGDVLSVHSGGPSLKLLRSQVEQSWPGREDAE